MSEKLTICSGISASVKKFADMPALTYTGEEPITYKSLGARVESVSAFLGRQGISRGDKVAVLGEN